MTYLSLLIRQTLLSKALFTVACWGGLYSRVFTDTNEVLGDRCTHFPLILLLLQTAIFTNPINNRIFLSTSLNKRVWPFSIRPAIVDIVSLGLRGEFIKWSLVEVQSGRLSSCTGFLKSQAQCHTISKLHQLIFVFIQSHPDMVAFSSLLNSQVLKKINSLPLLTVHKGFFPLYARRHNEQISNQRHVRASYPGSAVCQYQRTYFRQPGCHDLYI